jgi:hypothetical protein
MRCIPTSSPSLPRHLGQFAVGFAPSACAAVSLPASPQPASWRTGEKGVGDYTNSCSLSLSLSLSLALSLSLSVSLSHTHKHTYTVHTHMRQGKKLTC